MYYVNNSIFFSRFPSAPQDSPENLEAEFIAQTRSIELSWSEVECAHQNGPILGYRVRRHGSSPVPVMYEILGERNTRLRVLDNIHPNQPYMFSVAAFNNAGIGVFSEELLIVTDEDMDE